MTTLCTVNLTGTKMSKLGSVADQITMGTPLAIVARPDNAYDSEAMSVHLGHDVTAPFVGWIPAKEFEDRVIKQVLFRLAQAGTPLIGRVAQFNAETRFLRVDVCLTPDFAVSPFDDYREDDADDR